MAQNEIMFLHKNWMHQLALNTLL